MTDTIRSSLEWVLQQLIAAETTAVIGAGPQERTETRAAQRSGHRPKLISFGHPFPQAAELIALGLVA